MDEIYFGMHYLYCYSRVNGTHHKTILINHKNSAYEKEYG